ncbi:hypothetical protein CBR_g49197, partial [Chara braunii]
MEEEADDEVFFTQRAYLEHSLSFNIWCQDVNEAELPHEHVVVNSQENVFYFPAGAGRAGGSEEETVQETGNWPTACPNERRAKGGKPSFTDLPILSPAATSQQLEESRVCSSTVPLPPSCAIWQSSANLPLIGPHNVTAELSHNDVRHVDSVDKLNRAVGEGIHEQPATEVEEPSSRPLQAHPAGSSVPELDSDNVVRASLVSVGETEKTSDVESAPGLVTPVATTTGDVHCLMSTSTPVLPMASHSTRKGLLDEREETCGLATAPTAADGVGSIPTLIVPESPHGTAKKQLGSREREPHGLMLTAGRVDDIDLLSAGKGRPGTVEEPESSQAAATRVDGLCSTPAPILPASPHGTAQNQLRVRDREPHVLVATVARVDDTDRISAGKQGLWAATEPASRATTAMVHGVDLTRTSTVSASPHGATKNPLETREPQRLASMAARAGGIALASAGKGSSGASMMKPASQDEASLSAADGGWSAFQEVSKGGRLQKGQLPSPSAVALSAATVLAAIRKKKAALASTMPAAKHALPAAQADPPESLLAETAVPRRKPANSTLEPLPSLMMRNPTAPLNLAAYTSGNALASPSVLRWEQERQEQQKGTPPPVRPMPPSPSLQESITVEGPSSDVAALAPRTSLGKSHAHAEKPFCMASPRVLARTADAIASPSPHERRIQMQPQPPCSAEGHHLRPPHPRVSITRSSQSSPMVQTSSLALSSSSALTPALRESVELISTVNSPKCPAATMPSQLTWGQERPPQQKQWLRAHPPFNHPMVSTPSSPDDVAARLASSSLPVMQPPRSTSSAKSTLQSVHAHSALESHILTNLHASVASDLLSSQISVPVLGSVESVSGKSLRNAEQDVHHVSQVLGAPRPISATGKDSAVANQPTDTSGFLPGHRPHGGVSRGEVRVSLLTAEEHSWYIQTQGVREHSKLSPADAARFGAMTRVVLQEQEEYRKVIFREGMKNSARYKVYHKKIASYVEEVMKRKRERVKDYPQDYKKCGTIDLDTSTLPGAVKFDYRKTLLSGDGCILYKIAPVQTVPPPPGPSAAGPQQTPQSRPATPPSTPRSTAASQPSSPFEFQRPKLTPPPMFSGEDPKVDVADWVAAQRTYLSGFKCDEDVKVSPILARLERSTLKWCTSTSNKQGMEMADWAQRLGVAGFLQALQDQFADKEQARKAADKILRLGQKKFDGSLSKLYFPFESLTSTPGLEMRVASSGSFTFEDSELDETWEEDYAQTIADLFLSLQEKKKHKSELILLRPYILGAKIKGLLDCGATRNFISPKAVSKLHLDQRLVKLRQPLEVRIGDSSTVRITTAVKGLLVSFDKQGEVRQRLNFYVFPNVPFDLVFSMQWLGATNPRIDWQIPRVELPDRHGVYRPCMLADEYHPASSCYCMSARKFLRFSSQTDHARLFVAYVKQTDVETAPCPSQIQQVVDSFSDLMEEPTRLVHRQAKHKIEIVPGSVPPKGRVYRMSPAELEELRKQLETLTSKGWIRPSTSEFGAPVLFVPKGNGEFRMKFIKNFSAIAAPLTDLTKKDTSFLWTSECQEAFTRLKEALIRALVLKLPDPTLPFVLTTDASQYGVGAVLQQDDGNGLQPIEYMSKKIKTKKLQDSTYEKELYALVSTVKHWKHFLLGRHFKIFSDHSTLQWMKSQGEPNDKLARYIQFIDMFDFELRHKKGCYNRVADALSRRPDALFLISFTHSFGERTRQTIAQLLPQDEIFGPIVRNLQDDPAFEPGYTLVSGLLHTCSRGEERLCIPQDRKLRTLLMSEGHDARGHFGALKSYAALSQRFFWKEMRSDMLHYVDTCELCQRNKVVRRPLLSLLKPLPIPDAPAQSVSIDFTDLGRTTPRDQQDWDLHQSRAQLVYNTSVHSSTGFTPYRLHWGREPRQPLDDIIDKATPTLTPGTAEFTRRYRVDIERARANLLKAQKVMIQQANKHKRPSTIRTGDWVWVLSSELSREEDISPKLLPRYMGPWQVLDTVGADPFGPSYNVDVPLHLQTYPVFHASKLLPFTPADAFPDRPPQFGPPIPGKGYEVENVEDES